MRRIEEEVAQNTNTIVDIDQSLTPQSEINFIFISRENAQSDSLSFNSAFDACSGYKYTFEVEVDGKLIGEQIYYIVSKQELKRFKRVEDFHSYLRKNLLYMYNIGVERRARQKLAEDLELTPGDRI